MTVSSLTLGNLRQIMFGVANTVSKDQFMRELVYNGIQAAQRAGGGSVHVDYDLVAGVPKLRFWDTGDGMGRPDLFGRLTQFATESSTGENFGIGAKVSLVHVSPYGAVFTSVRDGVAHQLVLAAEDGTYGPRVLDPDAADEVARHTRTVDLDDPVIPDAIRQCGHGTVVTLLGTGAHDATASSLAPDGDGDAKRWVTHLLNDRFVSFPAGVTVHVAALGVNASGKTDNRHVLGTAGHADHYVATGPAKVGDLDVDGAKGAVKLTASIPATAHWWVLPNKQVKDDGRTEKRQVPSLYRLGGKVRVVLGHETYLTSARALRDAGIWANTGRIQVHVVPDPDVAVSIDPGRSFARVNDVTLAEALPAWCAELARKQPQAIAALQRSTTSRSGGDKHKAKIEELYTGLAALAVRSNRGRLRGTPTGTIVAVGDTAPDPRPETGSATRRLRDRVRDRIGEGRTARRRAAAAGTSSSAELARVDGTGSVAAKRAAAAPITAPTVQWVNHLPGSENVELTDDKVGFYVATSHTLVLNAKFRMVQMLIDYWTSEIAHLTGAREKVTEYVMDTFEGQMRSLIAGNLMLVNGDVAALAERLSDEALTVAACEVRQTNNRIKQAVKNTFTTAAEFRVTDDEDADVAPSEGCDAEVA